MGRRRVAGTALLLAVLMVGTACSDPASTPGPDAGEGETSGSSTSEASPTEDAPDEPDRPVLPSPGTVEEPAVVDPATALLDWRDLGDPEQSVVTVGPDGWTLTVDRQARAAVLDGPFPRRVVAPRGFRIGDAVLTDRHALVVAQDEQETLPASAMVVDLSDGSRRVLDGDSSPATVSGGSWALGEGRVYHPTRDREGAYCLAEVDLATGEGMTSYCAPARSGFTEVRTTPQGLSLLTFEATRGSGPACRTVASVGEASLEPFTGVTRCRGWEGLLLEGGAVWTEVPDENQVEASVVRARVGDGYYDLGPANTGSLVWCHGAAYFSRDPQRDRGPARLLRWDGRSLAVVLESGEGGPATLSSPRCGGDAITVSLLAGTGDGQLTAPLT